MDLTGVLKLHVSTTALSLASVLLLLDNFSDEAICTLSPVNAWAGKVIYLKNNIIASAL